MTGKPGKTRSPAKEKETKENNWTRKIFGVRRRRRTQKDNIRRGKSDDEQKETSGMDTPKSIMTTKAPAALTKRQTELPLVYSNPSLIRVEGKTHFQFSFIIDYRSSFRLKEFYCTGPVLFIGAISMLCIRTSIMQKQTSGKMFPTNLVAPFKYN